MACRPANCIRKSMRWRIAPNTITPPNGGPAIEFAEAMFGADLHCGLYDPALFGSGPPNFGWGPPSLSDCATGMCPQQPVRGAEQL